MNPENYIGRIVLGGALAYCSYQIGKSVGYYKGYKAGTVCGELFYNLWKRS